MNNVRRQTRRILAMVLTLCMLFSSVSGIIPTWFAAFAEEERADSGGSGSSDSSSHSESSSSDSVSHSESSSSDGVSHSESGSSDSGSHSESSSSDSESGASDSSSHSESSFSDSEPSARAESSSSDSENSSSDSETDSSAPASEGSSSQDSSAASDDTSDSAPAAVAEVAVTGESDGAVAEPSEPSAPAVEASDASDRSDEPSETDVPGDVAASEDVPETPEVTDTEPSQTEEEATAFTTQAHTAPVTLATSEEEEAPAPSAVQQKIDDAIAAVSGKLSGKLKVALAKDVTYEGDVDISKDKIDREVADDFELEIAAEDDSDDEPTEGGATVFSGTMTIQGINVAIRGIGLTGKVSVEAAKLAYTGTDAADTVNVEVGDDASADIQTGAGDDIVSAEVKAGGSATIRTGEGDDKVEASLTGNEKENSIDIDTGDGDDAVKLTDDAMQGTATVNTGSGDDTVKWTPTPRAMAASASRPATATTM